MSGDGSKGGAGRGDEGQGFGEEELRGTGGNGQGGKGDGTAGTVHGEGVVHGEKDRGEDEERVGKEGRDETI